MLTGKMRLAYQQAIKGTPSDKDQEMIDSMIPSPDAWKWGVSRQYDELENIADSEMQDTFDVYNVRPEGSSKTGGGFGFGQ